MRFRRGNMTTQVKCRTSKNSMHWIRNSTPSMTRRVMPLSGSFCVVPRPPASLQMMSSNPRRKKKSLETSYLTNDAGSTKRRSIRIRCISRCKSFAQWSDCNSKACGLANPPINRAKCIMASSPPMDRARCCWGRTSPSCMILNPRRNWRGSTSSRRRSNRSRIDGQVGSRGVRCEDREARLGPPAALREDALARDTLAPHADLVHHAKAGRVLERDVGLDAVETKLAKAEREHPPRELGGIAAAAEGVRNPEAKARDRGMRASERNAADHAAVAPEPRHIVVDAPPLAVAAILEVVGDPLRDIGEFRRLDRLVKPLGRRVLPCGFDRRRVLRRELAQDQSLGFKLRQHRGTVGSCHGFDSTGSRRGNAGFKPEGALTSKARGFAERGVDAVLPARAVFLEEIEHVAVDAQRHHLLDARDRRRLCQRLRHLGGRLLECRFGGVARIVGSSGHGIRPYGVLDFAAAIVAWIRQTVIR